MHLVDDQDVVNMYTLVTIRIFFENLRDFDYSWGFWKF